MIDLRSYIKGNDIDGHTHLFDKDGCIFRPSPDSIKKYVGFIDIEPKYISQYQSCMNYYKDYIENHLNDNIILLASSVTPQEMIDMHKKWGNWIKGFGEIKCYNEWKGEELKLDRLSEYWNVCKYAGENNLPVYIHFSLYDIRTRKRFENLLKRFPQTTFVLCHCGMDEKTDNDFCYHSVCKLMKEFDNLWVDITWKSFDYFRSNPLKINQLDLSRVILGSDQNRLSKKENINSKFDEGFCYINSDRNIKRLFNI